MKFVFIFYIIGFITLFLMRIQFKNWEDFFYFEDTIAIMALYTIITIFLIIFI